MWWSMLIVIAIAYLILNWWGRRQRERGKRQHPAYLAYNHYQNGEWVNCSDMNCVCNQRTEASDG